MSDNNKLKMEMIANYKSNTCVCGKQKKKFRHVCLGCKELLLHTPAEDDMSAKCAAHCEAIDTYLNLVKIANKIPVD